jgi:uncharacterized membrane protein YhaH (DUF805 family)
MICSNCGTENEQGTAFCGNCGVAQNGANSSVVDSYPQQQSGRVGFADAVRLGLNRWSDFKGRSTRSEYWWFCLFTVLVNLLATIIDGIVGLWGIFELIASLGLIIPGLAVAVRRLHDINRTGWWLLLYIGFIVIIPPFILLYFYLQPSDQGSNRFGPRP